MLIIGIAGTELSAQEREGLQHPSVAGVILFKRNFASREQVTDLAQAIRAVAPRPQLLCVDQEGGPVQRFRDGFSKLPALAPFGPLYDRDPAAALRLAHEHAWLMASEIRAIGLDLSFAPVVDLGRGNLAIGDRAFHADPQVVAAFTRAYVQGMHAAGMAATLKHFPGHGSVLEDTHFDEAIDPRPMDVLEREDLVPFVAGIEAGAEAVMLAHVTYPAIAPEPAGYSPFWLKDVLRERMGFRGGVRRRHQGPHRRAPGCRLRRGAGLRPGAGRGQPEGLRRSRTGQHGGAHGPDGPRCVGLAGASGRRATPRHPVRAQRGPVHRLRPPNDPPPAGRRPARLARDP